MSGNEIVIVGGAGQFGAFYTKFFSAQGFKVKIFDLDNSLAEKQAKLIGCGHCRTIDCVKEADFVAISVPIGQAVECIERVMPLVKDCCFVFDFCSVKTDVCAALEKAWQSAAKKNVEIASIHPMHGPRVGSVFDASVVFIPIKTAEKYLRIKRLFESQKARVFEASAEEHDKALAIVQGLTHFVQIASAKAIAKNELDIEKIRKYSSPVFELFLGTISRVVMQNPELYAAIQAGNRFNDQTRSDFITAALDLNKTIETMTLQDIAKEIQKAGEIFKKQESFFHHADNLISAMHSELSHIEKLANKKILLQNILTKKYHCGAIKKIFFKENELLFEEDEKEIRLRIENIRLCPKNEMDAWREENVRVVERDYSFLVDENCKEQAVLQALSAIKRGRFELIGSFSGKQILPGKKSLTFRAKIFEDENIAKIDKKIIALIEGLGFKLR